MGRKLSSEIKVKAIVRARVIIETNIGIFEYRANLGTTDKWYYLDGRLVVDPYIIRLLNKLIRRVDVTKKRIKRVSVAKQFKPTKNDRRLKK